MATSATSWPPTATSGLRSTGTSGRPRRWRPTTPGRAQTSRDGRVRQWRRGRFPRITVSYGEALRLEPVAWPTREQSADAAETIFDRVRAMYVGLEHTLASGEPS